MTPVPSLGPGEVGYLIAGVKDVGEARSGETVTEAGRPAAAPLAGYANPKPMVFCGLFPVDGDEFESLREALVGDFKSVANWRTEFAAIGKALRGGSGWVLLSWSPRPGRGLWFDRTRHADPQVIIVPTPEEDL